MGVDDEGEFGNKCAPQQGVVAVRAGQIFVLLRVVSERSMARDGCSS